MHFLMKIDSQIAQCFETLIARKFLSLLKLSLWQTFAYETHKILRFQALKNSKKIYIIFIVYETFFLFLIFMLFICANII